MEGVSGGGRGKGKKNKAAKKKAVAAAAAANQKKATVGAKKVVSSHPQIVSAAPEPATTSHDQPMTKSKRKRLKKQAAAEALKAAKRSPTAASAPPKAKVAVLTPPAAAVKPHVVSLTGSKKKKRKLSAILDTSVEDVASTALAASPKEGQLVQSSKTKKKKKVAVLGSAGAPPSAGMKSKTAASPNSRPQVHKNESASTSVGASPLNMVKKAKAKSIKLDAKEPEGNTTSETKATKPEKGTQSAQETQTKEIKTTLKTNVKVNIPLITASTKEESTPDSATIASMDTRDSKSLFESKVAVMAPTVSTNPSQLTPTAATGATSVTSKSDGTSATSASQQQVAMMKPAPAKTRASDHTLPPSGSLKRRRSIDHTSASSSADSLQPPAKRNSSKVGVVQSKTVQQTGSSDAQVLAAKKLAQDSLLSSEIQRTQPAESFVSVKEPHATAKTDAAIAVPSAKLPSTSSQPLTPLPSNCESVNRQVIATSKHSKNVSSDSKTPSKQIQVATSKAALPVAKQAEPKATGVSTKKAVGFASATKASSSSTEIKKMGIIMDSHAYVEKMMRSDRQPRALDTNYSRRPEYPTETLPERPQNAWGASFGMVPSAQGVSPAPRTLSTTPLSSWFLSNGCANFVKQVHFSDDDADVSDDDGNILTEQLASPGIGNTSPKRRGSTTKKNSFLESLTTQASWRTWYGNVDTHNLLDPPLTHVPENVRVHDVKPLALPAEGSAPSKKTSELEMLEADIRRERKRGSAFSQQLLMMLQGRTVSGKLLEEEYKPVLQQ
ncbi:hypothetical protein PInf_024166 [Phytophthora infestans]|nr:hypothetical protein PInf_024166 [Phytophthora infestans]